MLYRPKNNSTEDGPRPAVLDELPAPDAAKASGEPSLPASDDARKRDEAPAPGQLAQPGPHVLHTVEAPPAQAKAQPAPPDEPGTASQGTTKTTPPLHGLRRLIIPLSAVGVVVVLVIWASNSWDVWLGAASIQTTDNATVRAETTRLSTRVSGNVKRVAVQDFQHVKTGDLLVEIDPADYEAELAEAEAKVAAAEAALSNLENQKAHQRAVIGQAEAQRQAALARVVETKQERKRQDALLSGGLAGTTQRVEHATAAHDSANAALAASEATIEAERSQLDFLNGQQALLSANLRAAHADLATAKLHLGYTRIPAPFDGVVGERDVQEGDFVDIGTNLIAVVPLPNVYVVANYKETQLTNVVPGQPVEVTIDMFPGQVLQARVTHLSPASGATFALLPPDNATGNFTKVVQRIPVRIEFDPGQPLVEQLRPGMSVVTRIHAGGAIRHLAQIGGPNGG